MNHSLTTESVKNAEVNASELIDSFNRKIRYLRLSVTDRCNLRCTYCMAEDMTFLPKSKVLSLEELEIVGRAFVELGVQKIRLTGGEPLVRQGVIDLATKLKKISGLQELVMTTNGVLLDKFAQPLVDAGVSRLNISIDSLRPDRFKRLTRFGEIEDLHKGLQHAKQAGFDRIKLNAVILNGINHDEVLSLTQFAVDNGFDISFIEEMPLGEIDSHARINTQISSLSIKQQLEEKYSLKESVNTDLAAGPSRYMAIENSDTRVGFISPMTDNFCGSCNRVRVTVEGQLLLCLGNEHSLDLREIIRQSPEKTEILEQESTRLEALKLAVVKSMQIKPERHYFDPKDIRITRHMSATGG